LIVAIAGENLDGFKASPSESCAVKSHRFPLEVLFPRVRAKVFELLFGAASREHYVRELALRSHLTLHTIQDELRKLSALGLVTSRPHGSYRYYEADPQASDLFRDELQAAALFMDGY
jgi:hypothetical protein